MIDIQNGDCLELIKALPDESVDLVVTDCPYHIVSGGCSTGTYGNNHEIFNKVTEIKKDSHGNKFMTGSKHISLCGMLNDYDPYTYTRQGKLFKHNDIKFQEWLPEVYRVLKQGTHCYIMINARNLKELQEKAEEVGFEFQNILIWNKGNATPNRYYLNAYEMILMLRKGKARNINKMGTKNILDIKNIRGNKLHPTEKPVELMKILIENSSNENEIVLDPFMGAGSTGLACKELNRKFIGYEIDEKYYNVAKERIFNVEEKQTTIYDFLGE